eukprot:m.198963 g.198963  ORF g.198963 m.198963 type:complete len:441 (+) comp32715_c0_seq3:382-1704(+)
MTESIHLTGDRSDQRRANDGHVRESSCVGTCLQSLVCCAPCATPLMSACTLFHGQTEAIGCCPLGGCTPCASPHMVAVVTGANRGIGYHTARALLNQGLTVHLLCRNPKFAEQAVTALKKSTGNSRCETFQVDLGDLGSVKEYIKHVESQQTVIVSLVNNAGLLGSNAMNVNHLGHYALTIGLLPALHRGFNARSGMAHVVNVASAAHMSSFTMEKTVAAMADGSNHGDEGWGDYSDSKAANVLFSFGLARRVGHLGISVVSYHPGVLATDLWTTDRGSDEANASSFSAKCCCRYTVSPCIKHPRVSAAGLSALANPRILQRCLCSTYHPKPNISVLGRTWAQCITGSNGGYHQQCLCCCVVPVRPSPPMHNMGLQDRLWDASMQKISRDDEELGAYLTNVLQKQMVTTTSGTTLVSPAVPCTEVLAAFPMLCACISCIA